VRYINLITQSTNEIFATWTNDVGGESTLDIVLYKSWGNSGVAASTSRHWKPCNTGPGVALPGCGGASVWGFSFAGCRFLCAGILLCSLSMSGAALSTRLRGALRLRGSCSWLGERKGSWMVGYCVSVQDVLSQGILWTRVLSPPTSFVHLGRLSLLPSVGR